MEEKNKIKIKNLYKIIRTDIFCLRITVNIVNVIGILVFDILGG